MKDEEIEEFYLSLEELITISEVFNEICNGVRIDSREFQTRIGVTKEEASFLMEKIQSEIRKKRQFDTKET